MTVRGFAAAVDPISRYIVSETTACWTVAPNSEPTWTTGNLWIKPQHIPAASNTCRDPPEPSTSSYSQHRSRSGQRRVQIPSICASWATAEVVLGEQSHHEHSHAQIPKHLSSIMLGSWP